MKVLIVENDRPAIEPISKELLAIDEHIDIVGECTSVEEGIQWLNNNSRPDLIFMDIQLSDGLSFNILDTCQPACPLIFLSTCHEHQDRALDYCSIDYLIRPIPNNRLKNALHKYKSLQTHFSRPHPTGSGPLNNGHNGYDRKRSRILVKKGMEYQPVRVEDTGYFFTEHKLVFLVDKENRKYMAEKSNLTELEEELDSNIFYRANRKYIINANYVKRFKPLERSKISVELVLPVNEEIIISQENSASFKKWIGEI